MEWQDILSVGIAAVCGIWVVWRWLRPLFRRESPGCTLCDECNLRPPSRDLLHIDQPDSGN